MFAIPFGDQADSSTITTIPQSKTAIGRASMALGFPKETFTPIAAGGVPPYGEDMNGILHMLAQAARAAEAGLVRPFSQNYANSINGYPLGAIVAHPSISGRYVMNAQDNNTAAPPGNGWIDPLSDFVTNEAMASSIQQETARAEAAEGAIFQLPAWVPLYCPFSSAPAGYLPGDGRMFDPVACPQLAAAFPTHQLPATQGLFFRSLDTTNQIDNYDPADNIGRSVLSTEEGSYIVNGNGGGLATAAFISGQIGLAYSGQDAPYTTSHNPTVATVAPGAAFPATPQQYSGYGVARPKNMAWLVVFRAA